MQGHVQGNLFFHVYVASYWSEFAGYRVQNVPTALLQRWYSLVREKRASKLDFLKSLVRVFDMNTSLSSTQDDIDFARYMVENFATFDYKSQEEVLMVVKNLIAVLSTAGMQLMELLSPSHLLTQLREPVQPNLGDIEMSDAQVQPGSLIPPNGGVFF